MKDTRPTEYCLTTKRTVAELTKEELEIVVCNFIDDWAHAKTVMEEVFENQTLLIPDQITSPEFQIQITNPE